MIINAIQEHEKLNRRDWIGIKTDGKITRSEYMFEGVKELNGNLHIYNVRDFNLKDIFECGQCFRWNQKDDGSYTGVAFGKAVNISYLPEEGKDSGTVVIKNSSEADFENVWRKYFDLDRDYGAIKAILAENDDVMKEAIGFGSGIRILNQDEWETLISFILSQNRNIPLIKKSIEHISRKFGKRIQGPDDGEYFAFPEPEVLANIDEAELDECRLGYRARYVMETSRAIAENKEALYAMTKADYAEAFAFLKSLCGVGPKVANCVLLFSMEKYESFPIDVWVRRLMSVLYGTDENNLKEIQEYADRKFGELGGFAQQYLFYNAREKGLGK